MSHFTVAVFREKGQDLDSLLGPFNENLDVEFVNVEARCKEEYENEEIELVKTPDGKYLFSFDELFRVHGTIGTGRDTHKVPEGQGYEVVTVNFNVKYPTLKDFMEDYHGYKYNEEHSAYGYYTNPNAKWDWWSIGGRWEGLIETKAGKKVNSAFMCDINLEGDKKVYIEAIRTWELLVEGVEPETDLDKEILDDFHYKKEYYLERYGDKENYALECSTPTTYAILLPDGTWIEPGEMGWFGCSSATNEGYAAYREKRKEVYSRALENNWNMTIVDCHI